MSIFISLHDIRFCTVISFVDEMPVDMSSSTISSIASLPLEEALSYALSVLGSPKMILKEEQKEAITAIYDGKVVFMWLLTVFRKRVWFQALPFVFDYKLGLCNV